MTIHSELFLFIFVLSFSSFFIFSKVDKQPALLCKDTYPFAVCRSQLGWIFAFDAMYIWPIGLTRNQCKNIDFLFFHFSLFPYKNTKKKSTIQLATANNRILMTKIVGKMFIELSNILKSYFKKRIDFFLASVFCIQ